MPVPGCFPYGCRSNAGSYFDWILPAIYSYGERYPVYVDSDSKEQSEFAEEFQKGWEKEQLLEHIREADTKGVNREAFLLLSENGRGFLKDKDIRFRIKTQGYGI